MKKYQIFVLTALAILASCKGMNDNIEEYLNRGELNYLGRPDSAYVLGGNGRVNILWRVNDDPRITGATIYWNDLDNNEQHQDYTINRGSLTNGYASVLLNLPEGTYVFKIVHTGGAENTPSIETEVSGISYGESYLTSMRNKGFINIATRWGNGLIIQWSNTDGLTCDLSYTDVKDQKKTLTGITDFTKAVIIPDFKSDLTYSMTVLPAANALDNLVVTDVVTVNYKNYTLSAAEPTIIPIVDFDLGGEGVAFHDTDSGNSGGITYRTDNGDPDGNAIDVQNDPPNIGWTNAGEWINYTVYVQDAGTYIADINASVNSSAAYFLFRVDGVNATGDIPATNDGAWDNYAWRTERHPNNPKGYLELTEGYHTITFFEVTGGYNVRSLRFTKTNHSVAWQDKLLDKTLFASANLPGDNNTISGGQAYTSFFDDNTQSLWVSGLDAASADFPLVVSLDFGVTARLSKFRLWGQPGYYYNNYGFVKFEVYGTDELKSGKPDSYWTGDGWKSDWTKFGDYETKRVSGETGPVDSPNAEDLAAAQAGWEFSIPSSVPKCRYVRFVVHSIWGVGKKGLCMAEVSFYGE